MTAPLPEPTIRSVLKVFLPWYFPRQHRRLHIVGRRQVDWVGRTPAPTLEDIYAKHGRDLHDPDEVLYWELRHYTSEWPPVSWKLFNRLRKNGYIAPTDQGDWNITEAGKETAHEAYRPRVEPIHLGFSKYRRRQLVKAGKLPFRSWQSVGRQYRDGPWSPPADVAAGRLRTRKPRRYSKGYQTADRKSARAQIESQLE